MHYMGWQHWEIFQSFRQSEQKGVNAVKLNTSAHVVPALHSAKSNNSQLSQEQKIQPSTHTKTNNWYMNGTNGM